MRKVILTTVVSSLLIAGCANTSSNQTKGAAIGAVIGALAGKGTGDNDKSRYVWGAAVGALAGGAIGNYMDRQEQEFRDQLADSGVDVVREGDDLRLILPGNITFKTGSAAISSNFFPILNDVALILNRYEKTLLSIEGHTDNVGSSESNQTLSEARANSVSRYLADQQISPNRIRTQGFGEYSPIVSNNSAANRQKNRRVELKIIPNRQ